MAFKKPFKKEYNSSDNSRKSYNSYKKPSYSSPLAEYRLSLISSLNDFLGFDGQQETVKDRILYSAAEGKIDLLSKPFSKGDRSNFPLVSYYAADPKQSPVLINRIIIMPTFKDYNCNLVCSRDGSRIRFMSDLDIDHLEKMLNNWQFVTGSAKDFTYHCDYAFEIITRIADNAFQSVGKSLYLTDFGFKLSCKVDTEPSHTYPRKYDSTKRYFREFNDIYAEISNFTKDRYTPSDKYANDHEFLKNFALFLKVRGNAVDVESYKPEWYRYVRRYIMENAMQLSKKKVLDDEDIPQKNPKAQQEQAAPKSAESSIKQWNEEFAWEMILKRYIYEAKGLQLTTMFSTKSNSVANLQLTTKSDNLSISQALLNGYKALDSIFGNLSVDKNSASLDDYRFFYKFGSELKALLDQKVIQTRNCPDVKLYTGDKGGKLTLHLLSDKEIEDKITAYSKDPAKQQVLRDRYAASLFKDNTAEIEQLFMNKKPEINNDDKQKPADSTKPKAQTQAQNKSAAPKAETNHKSQDVPVSSSGRKVVAVVNDIDESDSYDVDYYNTDEYDSYEGPSKDETSYIDDYSETAAASKSKPAGSSYKAETKQNSSTVSINTADSVVKVSINDKVIVDALNIGTFTGNVIKATESSISIKLDGEKTDLLDNGVFAAVIKNNLVVDLNSEDILYMKNNSAIERFKNHHATNNHAMSK